MFQLFANNLAIHQPLFRPKILVRCLLALSLIASVFHSAAAFADSEIIPTESNDAWLQVSPVAKRLNPLNPGEITEDSFKINNLGDREITVEIYTTPYFMTSTTPDSSFESDNIYTQISRWIKFLDQSGKYLDRLSIQLGAGENKEIKYQITIPKDVASGGQYASIFAESVPDESQGVSTSTRIGMPLYTSVKGKTRTGAKITKVEMNHISFDNKLHVAADVENTGNIDFQSSNEVTLSTIFGQELQNNTAVQTIFPDSINTVLAELNSPSIGFFKLTYKIRALDEVIEETHIVLVLPPFIIAIGLALLVLTIVVVGHHIIQKRKTKKRPSTPRALNSKTLKK